MEKITIKLLSLLNFKGIKQFEIADFNGGVSIFGNNATGKTTLFDGFSWLLFGKDSLNSANFEIKPLTEKGEALHGLQHEVEAILNTGKGDISLKKVYQERYTKRRGAPKAVFTGHKVHHFVNSVPCKMKEFTLAVNNICTEDVFRLLTNPRYFNEILHWTDRRDLLLKVCGDVSDADVIASNPDLVGLKDILGKRTKDEHKKLIAGKQAEINEQLVKIPPRIDENKAAIIEVHQDDGQTQAKLKDFKSRKSDKSLELRLLKSGAGIAEKEKAISEIEAKIQVHKNEVSEKNYKRLEDQRKEISALDKIAIGAASKTENAVLKQTDKLKRKKKMAKDKTILETERDKLRTDWFAKDKEQMQSQPETDICPACGEKIPKFKIEEASRLALEAFNLDKSKALEAISIKGKGTADELTVVEKHIADNDAELKTMDTEIQKLAHAQDMAERAIDERKAEHDQTNLTIPPDEILQGLETEKDTLDLDANALRAGTYEGELAIEQELERIDSMIELLNKDALKIESNERIATRIAMLEKEERDLGAEYERLEGEIFLIESFIRTKVALLQPKIAKKFKHATFRLFVENINGGVEECCDTTLDGVPYTSMNNGGRINIGLDICNTLSEYYGISLPCFIDNSEAVTRLFDTDAQQIRLFVSEEDKKLRIENI